jgi:predicted GH43/DUF377 family glycosyl hydrolase
MVKPGMELRPPLLTRSSANPILSAHDWPYFVNTVFNPGAIRLASGETILLCRVEDRTGRSHLCAARSDDGITGWRIDPSPTLTPDIANYPEEKWGIEDPRIVWVEELDRFALAYTCYSASGPGVSMALTEDFVSFERLGNIMPPEDKDAALFPRRIGGRWALIHRPVPATGPAHIWISYSPDLKHWGDHSVVLRARLGPWWDANRIGLSPPLIETPRGWLMMYHGVRRTPAGCLYRVGLALLDIDDPSTCILRGQGWIMGPEAKYERTGDVGDVVFACGWTIAEDGDTLNVYYGAADTSICLAKASLSELMDWLSENGEADGKDDLS